VAKHRTYSIEFKIRVVDAAGRRLAALDHGIERGPLAQEHGSSQP
jgi:hypothetical protein